MASQLLTRYTLASVWTRLLIFIIFYFIVRELHFVDIAFSIYSVDCMQESSEKEIISEKNEQIQKNFDFMDAPNLENIFIPLIAESKNSIIQEIKEYLEERLSTKFTENVNGLDIKLARLEKRLMQEIDKSDCRLTTDVNLSLHHVKEGQKSLATIEFVERSKNKILAKQEIAQAEIQQSIKEMKAQIQALQNDIFPLRENIQEQISTLRQENHTAVLEVSSRLSYEHEDSTFFLSNCFNRKFDLVANELLSLKTQNQELQKTVTEHVSEAKNQKELIENIRKSFERKMQAKDLLITDLQQKNIELTKAVTDMQQAQSKMAHDFSIMRDHIEVLSHFQQASMHPASLETVADIKTIMSPSRTFPDLK
jgi:hypothetical protein